MFAQLWSSAHTGLTGGQIKSTLMITLNHLFVSVLWHNHKHVIICKGKASKKVHNYKWKIFHFCHVSLFLLSEKVDHGLAWSISINVNQPGLWFFFFRSLLCNIIPDHAVQVWLTYLCSEGAWFMLNMPHLVPCSFTDSFINPDWGVLPCRYAVIGCVACFPTHTSQKSNWW